MGLHVAPLLGGLLGDGNFAGSAGVSSMGMPHVDWLHGSMPSQVLPQPVDAGADPGGAVVSQAAATGWPSFSEEVDQVFDDVPLGEAVTVDEEGAASFRELITSVRESLGLPMPSSLASTLQTGVVRTSGTSRPGTTPLVLPHSPLALEVCREQLGCSLGISNPVSAKFTLPRRLASRAERWYTPGGDFCGAPPFYDDLLHLMESKDLSVWHMATQLGDILSSLVDITSWTDQVLGDLAGLSSAAPQRGLDCLGALARVNLDIMQPYEMLCLRMMMLHRQAVVRNLPNTYGDWERRQLMSSPVGSHLFDGQTLAVVEQRELESSQRSLVSQIACGLSSTAQGIRAKADHAIGSRCLAPVVPPSVPPPPALKVSGSFCSRRIFCGHSRGRRGLARDAAEVLLQVGLVCSGTGKSGRASGPASGWSRPFGMVLFSPSSGILSSRARLWSFWRTRGAQTVIWLWRLRFPRC
ncbi:uncharacterized protein LOC123518685 [Portunus trituberculatus]|uniref:uncharacterized protein LOC123518685 n=1 Tax=Portunus trituberculatus TaxID=210409 RepID=UPI001E1CC743|nr:uncharacterized protein LOC123518685 [Portunus trituberculatus]